MSSQVVILICVILITIAIFAMVLLQKLEFIQMFNKSFIRFIFVGGTNTLTYFLFFTILNIYTYYIVAHITAFLLSATISYFLTTIYTFRKEISVSTFIRFPLTYLPNLIMSTLGTWILVNFNIINENIASLLMMVLAIPITYAVGKLLYSNKAQISEEL